MTDEKMLDKVRKLLAKAEGASTTHEAEAFTAKATQLIIEHSIDAAMLSKADKSSEKIVTHTFRVEGYAKAKCSLLNAIVIAMDCKAIYLDTGETGWTTKSVVVTGWESDIESIEVLFASLLMQVTSDMEREAKLHPNVHGRAFKQAFILGFAVTISKRLTAQRASAVRTADDATPGAALAVVDRFRAVERAYAQAHPRTTRGTGPKATSNAGWSGGKAAGARANLGQTSVTGGRRALSR